MFPRGAAALVVVLVLGAVVTVAGARSTTRLAAGPVAAEDGQARAEAALARLPLAFEENRGQAEPEVSFLARSGGSTLFVTPTQAVLALGGEHGDGAALRLRPMGVAPGLQPRGVDPLPGKVNYLVGADPARWQHEVPTYGGVELTGVYPGIDLVYHGRSGRLEYDFVVAPGADPGAIRLAVAGARSVRLDRRGALIAATPAGSLTQDPPFAYQEEAGRRTTVPAAFVLEGGEVAFRLGGYDHGRPLVIDPTLTYSTYLGGGAADSAFGLAADAAGAAYVTGRTASTNFPTAGPFQATKKGGTYDAFVAKLNPGGSGLAYSTYLGGGGNDSANAIAVDGAGAAYVTGQTASTDFPTAGAFQATHEGGSNDVFVTKLNPSGSALAYSTYLGGGDYDFGFGIAVDGAGAAYVTGLAGSSDFPTASPFQATEAGAGDVFVTKLHPSGSTLVYSTYLGGGTEEEIGYGIAVDGVGAVYVTGQTASTDFPTAGPFQTTNKGSNDAFVTKLDPSGSALTYSTYLGGGGDDSSGEIALDSTGAAHVVGWTTSTDFPTAGPFQATNKGSNDAFVTKLDPSGSALTYSTYLGGAADDFGYGIALDRTGAAYVTGPTNSTDFPTASPLQPTLGGGSDGFVATLAPTGSTLRFATYLGGATDETFGEIAVGEGWAAYVIGSTTSSDFPTAAPLQPGTGGGGQDAFAAKLTINFSPVAAPDAATTPEDNPLAVPVTVNDTDPEGELLTAVIATQPAHGSVACSAGTCTYTPNTGFFGSDAFTYTVTDPYGAPAQASVAVTVTEVRRGYWMVGRDGAVYPFGEAGDHGRSTEAVDLEPTPSGLGYWIVDALGRVSAFGDATRLANADPSRFAPGETVTSLSATPSGAGYWLFTTKGRVLPIGDAGFFGDVSNLSLNGPVLDSISTPTGAGYFMVASDGGIFAFGDAVFRDSMGGKPLNAPVQSLVPDGDGDGYWLVATDGGIFAFDAPFRSSMGDRTLNRPVTGMVRFGNGYLMVGEDGGIFNFSDRPFFGSLGDRPPVHPIVSVAVLEFSAKS